jgi:hypothetical protein
MRTTLYKCNVFCYNRPHELRYAQYSCFLYRFSAGSMSKEGPKAPLWPEGISKVRPVENQRAKTLREGVAVPVVKEPSLAEQKDRERLSKPPPLERPVQAQSESKPGSEAAPEGQGENKKKFDYPVHPSETDPDWKSYSKRKRKQLDDEWFFQTIVEGIRQDNALTDQELRERTKRFRMRFGS